MRILSSSELVSVYGGTYTAPPAYCPPSPPSCGTRGKKSKGKKSKGKKSKGKSKGKKSKGRC